MAESSEISMKYINQELEALDARKTEIKEVYKTPDSDRKQNYQRIIFEQLGFEEKKLTAQAFIEKIKVYDDSIEITWKV